LLPLQALPPPAGGGGPGEQRSPAEIARAALRAPGGGDSTRRGVGGRVRSEGATGGWGPGGPAAGARRARSPRPAGVALRPADNWNAWARRRRGAGSDERGNERRGAEAKA
ncbi:unnamed protein product, partial [Prorocentrum cordatum]